MRRGESTGSSSPAPPPSAAHGVYWVVAPGSLQPLEDVPRWGEYAFGFITLTNDDDEIEYRVDDEVIARYVLDPDHEPIGCD